MDKRLTCIFGKETDNHLLPFLWMHEGHTAELRQYVRQVYDSGARAFCVESRPHEGFCRESWWTDMDIILSEARSLGMKVWILDDKHFPTGYANGLIDEKYPGLRRRQLIERHVDVAGPARDSALLIDMQEGDRLIGVYAYKRVSENEDIPDEAIDLTAQVHGKYVYFDIPEGVYRVFTLLDSAKGNGQESYISQISAESVHVLIEAVYEPHYAHYAEYFGSTIAGFFSDEPSFGNISIVRGTGNTDMYNKRLGQPGLALPWSSEVPALMKEELGSFSADMLPGLWYTQGGGSPGLRIAYMNAITKLWRRNFSLQLGEWCRAHNVEYIGHVIEDMNAHARLSCSGGHYFRSLDGQDMAGIDVVLHQIMPGMAHYEHTASCSGGKTDPEFFDYVLARLAASHSHIQPRMKNRAMCEIFGAYGWAEGVPFMKRLMDHMLVRGINHFVPHAFSPKYPDPDCPPHFGAGGDYPQAEGYAELMKYTNRTASILSEGTEVVGAAILYHAEAEWSGMGYMLMQKPAKRLYDSQINYDFLPADTIIEAARVENGRLTAGCMSYPALIVPYAEYLPAALMEKLTELCANGLRLAFIEGRPGGCLCGDVVSLDGVCDYVKQAGGADIELSKPFPLMRHMHRRSAERDIFMFVNESMSEGFDGEVRTCVQDGISIDLLRGCVKKTGGAVRLSLCPGESVLMVSGKGADAACDEEVCTGRAQTIDGQWQLTAIPAHGQGTSLKNGAVRRLFNLTGPGGDDGFSGRAIYEKNFTADEGAAMLDLGCVGECAHAWLNGKDLGVRIHAPYVYDIADAVRTGENTLKIEVANSLVHQQPDHFSYFMQIPPSGLLGPVRVIYKA